MQPRRGGGGQGNIFLLSHELEVLRKAREFVSECSALVNKHSASGVESARCRKWVATYVH